MDKLLQEMLDSGRVAGAYLMEGSQGYAEAEAEAFIGALFCKKHSCCGECPACVQIKAGSHPDILHITPSGQSQTIKVDDIAGVAAWVAQKPFEGGWKAVVIGQADAMVEAAQNKLLKAIEEPPERTVFILGAASRKNLLPTVLSRCIIIRMRQGKGEDLVPTLQERFAVSAVQAAVLAKTAGFDPYAAAELYARNYLQTREVCLRAAKRLLEAKNRAASVILDMLMQCVDRLDDLFLAWMLYIRDIVYYQKTADTSWLYNSDRIAEIKEYARIPAYKLVRILLHLQAANEKSKLCTGIQKKLLLESMLFEILEVVLS